MARNDSKIFLKYWLFKYNSIVGKDPKADKEKNCFENLIQFSDIQKHP